MQDIAYRDTVNFSVAYCLSYAESVFVYIAEMPALLILTQMHAWVIIPGAAACAAPFAQGFMLLKQLILVFEVC